MNRPDACSAGTAGAERNVAEGQPAVASRSLPDQPPAGAVDGTTAHWWGAGAGPTQWIEIDLGKPTTVSAVNLIVSQSPAGQTDHQIWVRGTNDHLQLVAEFKGDTTDKQILKFEPAQALVGIRYVRIVTVASPSWVAWQEIEVLGQ